MSGTAARVLALRELRRTLAARRLHRSTEAHQSAEAGLRSAEDRHRQALAVRVATSRPEDTAGEGPSGLERQAALLPACDAWVARQAAETQAASAHSRARYEECTRDREALRRRESAVMRAEHLRDLMADERRRVASIREGLEDDELAAGRPQLT